jgi:lysyl-tRNA synthetase class 2
MDQTNHWKPTADVTVMRARAAITSRIRQYFELKSVLEVETPILSHFGGTDVQLSQWQTNNAKTLHTSPEFGMKRLLAAGMGDIYQVCRVFRRDELGRKHNPEFTMLEWYRLGINEFQLMAEVTELISSLYKEAELDVCTWTYEFAFLNYNLPNPHHASTAELRECCCSLLNSDSSLWERDDCLDALMALVVEPSLPHEKLVYIHQYPKSQAALAKVEVHEGIQVGRRFELYWKGMELANGYYELTDVDEQLNRFQQDNEKRLLSGKETVLIDENFLGAMKFGLPECSGVALGVDRLMMILLEKTSISEVIAFPFDRA